MCMCNSALGIARNNAGSRSAAMVLTSFVFIVNLQRQILDQERRPNRKRAAQSRCGSSFQSKGRLRALTSLLVARHLAFYAFNVEVHPTQELVIRHRILG